MRILTFVAGAVAALAIATPAAAADHVVKMLNNGNAGMMVFEPALVKVAPGDTVTFQPIDKIHSAESIPGMIPAGIFSRSTLTLSRTGSPSPIGRLTRRTASSAGWFGYRVRHASMSGDEVSGLRAAAAANAASSSQPRTV